MLSCSVNGGWRHRSGGDTPLSTLNKEGVFSLVGESPEVKQHMAGGAIALSELCRTFYCANHHSLFLGETPPRDLGDTTYKQDRIEVWAGPRSVQQSQGHVAGRALGWAESPGRTHRFVEQAANGECFPPSLYSLKLIANQHCIVPSCEGFPMAMSGSYTPPAQSLRTNLDTRAIVALLHGESSGF